MSTLIWGTLVISTWVFQMRNCIGIIKYTAMWKMDVWSHSRRLGVAKKGKKGGGGGGGGGLGGGGKEGEKKRPESWRKVRDCTFLDYS